MATISMQTMRYINLLDRTAHVKTHNCFVYNNAIFFAVPRMMISKAIGQGASNIRKIQEQIGRRVKIIEEPHGTTDAERFIGDVVSPVGFKSVEIRGNEIIITAGTSSKAALIGRNRRRFDELRQILLDNFGLELKII